MKLLDRYLIKYFLIPAIFCTIALIFLVLVADVFDNLDEFIRNQVTLAQALTKGNTFPDFPSAKHNALDT